MKTISLSLALVSITLLPVAAPAAVDPAIIAADARWLVHLDFERLRDSAIGKELIATTQKKQQEATQGMIGVDVPRLLATLGTATAYGANFTKDPAAVDGTLIVRGTPDLRKIVEGLLLQATISDPKKFGELKDLPFPAYSWTNPKEAKNSVVIAFPPEPIVLVSKSKAQLLKARDVIRGSTPSLVQTPGAQLNRLLQSSRDAFFCASSIVPPEEIVVEDGPQARILKMTQAFSLALGENGPNTFAHAELVAASDEMADKLMKILQGLTAMLSLTESNDQRLAEFLNSTMVTRDGDTVSLQLAYSSERLVQMGRMLHQMQQAPQNAAHAAHAAPTISSGTVLAEWTAENVGDAPSEPATRTIENVTLKNGATITLGHRLNGGRAVRFSQVEIIPTGGGSPLVFHGSMMNRRNGNMVMLQFPGADGSYTLKIGYLNDGSGKASYAVSVRDPRPAPASNPSPAK